jgi:hypothetical protein
MSMGNAAATAEGKQPRGSRVEVNVLKNDLVVSAQQ